MGRLTPGPASFHGRCPQRSSPGSSVTCGPGQKRAALAPTHRHGEAAAADAPGALGLLPLRATGSVEHNGDGPGGHRRPARKATHVTVTRTRVPAVRSVQEACTIPSAQIANSRGPLAGTKIQHSTKAQKLLEDDKGEFLHHPGDGKAF